jgi:DNA helicase-2/ATP-dependent DNA helicase PcrA
MSDPFTLTDDAHEAALPISVRAAVTSRYLDGLNESQRLAVETLDGPLLVLAGAGTGKTRVLISRLAHILATRRAWPSHILAVTFTNKAAREMKERVAVEIGGAVEGLWLGTFHSLCVRILRRHAELLGLSSNFTILDTDDQLRLLKEIIKVAGIDDKRWPPRAVHAVIERWKDRGLTPDKLSAADAGEVAGGKVIELYRQYQERLKAFNACDFGDLLLHCLQLFTTHPDVVRQYQEQFHYILVDEYQDTNVAQYLWLRLLAQGARNICCVGDDDQSIYSWRGAEIANILRFERDFPGAKIVRLEQNYRSTQHILSAASGLIARNEGRLGKTLWSAGDAGDKITVRGVWDGEEEARLVADDIEALQRQGARLDDIAILVRAGFQTREFEERFITLGIPYRVIGGPRFYERQEIRDALAYLRLIHQQADSLAFERIINTPRRGIGDSTLQSLNRLARADGISLVEAARRLIETDELKPQTRKALSGFLIDLERWQRVAGAEPHADLARIVLDESGYTDMWKASKTPEAPGRLENLKEFVAALEEFDSLGGFLEHVALVTEGNAAAGGDMVNIMTLHAAKGLEFGTVFLPGWEEGLFPHQRALESGGTAALEEERRLAYVGLTRARRRVSVSFAANRRVHNQWQSAIPSRFIDELPEAHVEVASAPGLYGATGVDNDRISFAPRRTPLMQRRSTERRHEGGERRSADRSGGFSVGDRVFHEKFGYGRIRGVEDNKLDIEFEKAGRKKVIASFVAAT